MVSSALYGRATAQNGEVLFSAFLNLQEDAVSVLCRGFRKALTWNFARAPVVPDPMLAVL